MYMNSVIMKRTIFTLICVMMVSAVSAQTTTTTTAGQATATEQALPMPKTDWLTAFNGVKVDGQMNVVFKRVDKADDVRIIYDTKGNITSKFKFEVDKKGVLVISEKSDPKRTTVTDVTVYYHTLRDVKIAHAIVEFEDRIECNVFDLAVSGGAVVSLSIKTLDTAVECTGVSRLTIEGETKYLSLRVSTAKVDCSKLSTISTTVDTSHSAEVRVVVSERLEATTSTGAKLLYKGTPVILRNHNVIFGGDIININ